MPKKKEAVDLYEIKIILMYLEPPVWRRAANRARRYRTGQAATHCIRPRHLA